MPGRRTIVREPSSRTPPSKQRPPAPTRAWRGDRTEVRTATIDLLHSREPCAVGKRDQAERIRGIQAEQRILRPRHSERTLGVGPTRIGAQEHDSIPFELRQLRQVDSLTRARRGRELPGHAGWNQVFEAPPRQGERDPGGNHQCQAPRFHARPGLARGRRAALRHGPNENRSLATAGRGAAVRSSLAAMARALPGKSVTQSPEVRRQGHRLIARSADPPPRPFHPEWSAW